MSSKLVQVLLALSVLWPAAHAAQLKLGAGPVSIVAGTDPIQRNAAGMIASEVKSRFGRSRSTAAGRESEGGEDPAGHRRIRRSRTRGIPHRCAGE